MRRGEASPSISSSACDPELLAFARSHDDVGVQVLILMGKQGKVLLLLCLLLAELPILVRWREANLLMAMVNLHIPFPKSPNLGFLRVVRFRRVPSSLFVVATTTESVLFHCFDVSAGIARSIRLDRFALFFALLFRFEVSLLRLGLWLHELYHENCTITRRFAARDSL